MGRKAKPVEDVPVVPATPVKVNKVELPDWVRSPGLRWTDDAACRPLLFKEDGEVDPDAIEKFFVAAGHVITPQIRNICLTCPVRRECLIHSFLGNRGEMVPAGYFAGFSHGQRRTTDFETLYDIVEKESAQYRID